MAGKLSLVIIASIVLGTTCFGQSKRLRPSETYWEWAEFDGSVRTYRVPLARSRKLVAVGDTLYLLNRKNRIDWTWTVNIPFLDAPVVDSHGTIYVVGADLLWAAVDSARGQQKWRGTTNGRAAYTQIRLYRKKMYLVVTDKWGYRDSLRDPSIEDELSLCKGNAVLWETRIPARSTLQVRGSKVFVVYKRHGRFIRKRILVPRRFGKPISRISVHADYDGRQIVDDKRF